jgi:hypothetical protein
LVFKEEGALMPAAQKSSSNKLSWAKRILAIVCVTALLALAAYVSYTCISKTANTTVVIGESTKFTTSDIQAAVNCVKLDAATDPAIGSLKNLTFSQKKSDLFLHYYSSGNKTITQRQINDGDLIVLSGDFMTSSSGVDQGFDDNADYNGWTWTLIRDNKNAPWRVKDQGVC